MSRGLLIKELPDSERPRERLMEKGADALKHSELIAILLRRSRSPSNYCKSLTP
jgi:DNA repair protein RadC